MKVVPFTVRPDKANGVPSLDSCASTISKAFSDPKIAEFNTKVQVRVVSDPTTTTLATGLPSLPVSVRVDGVGAIQCHNNIFIPMTIK